MYTVLHKHLYKVLHKHRWRTYENTIESFLKMYISFLVILVIRTLDLQNGLTDEESLLLLNNHSDPFPLCGFTLLRSPGNVPELEGTMRTVNKYLICIFLLHQFQ